MAKPIIVSYEGETASFSFKKVDRAKLYGKRKRVALDSEGNTCQRAEISEDGRLLIRAGMTAQGYFDEDGTWVPNNVLVAIDEAGELIEKVPSTLGVEAKAALATPEQLLDLRVISVYMLDPLEVANPIDELLAGGQILSFPFNYRDDFHAETGFLVRNDEGVFAIIGNPVEPVWHELAEVVDDTFEEEESDDDLDFEMF